MAAQARPDGGKAGRPWYLVLALLLCSAFGAYGASHGWEMLEILRGAELDFTRPGDGEEGRVAVQQAGDRMVEAMDSERGVLFPLAAGELVLGGALFVFAAAAMMGRSGARRFVVQVLVAQTALVAATFFLTPKSRWTSNEVGLARLRIEQVAQGVAAETLDQQVELFRAMGKGVTIAALAVRSVVTVLVILALTRPRALAFYDAQTPTEG